MQRDAEGRRHGGEDVVDVADDIEGDEKDAGVEGRAGEFARDGEGEAGLADPTRAGEGDDPIVLAHEQIADRRDLTVAADHRVRRLRRRGGGAEGVEGSR